MVDGVRIVSVDKAWEAADVRPDDGDDGDAEFEQFSDIDDDERPARPQPFTPPQRAAAEARHAAAEAASADLTLEPPCVRCGAAEHAANACTVFLRDRGAEHSPDAARHGIFRDIGDDGTRAGLRGCAAVVVLVPETPDSLFAALTLAVRGLGANFMRAKAVTRKALGTWIRRHGDTQVNGQLLCDWVAFETDKGWRQAAAYADWMALDTSWAGPIDCAAFAALRGISVHVWRRVPSTEGFKRHASFDPPAGPAAHTVNLLHSRGRHYDVLLIERRRSPFARLCACTGLASLFAMSAAEAGATPERAPSPSLAAGADVSPHRSPPSTSVDDPAHVRDNMRMCPSLPFWCGVQRLDLDPSVASGLATFLTDRWVPNGCLELPSANPRSKRPVKLLGYVTYPLVVGQHSAPLQQRHTLLLRSASHLAAFRFHAPGFAELERAVLHQLGVISDHTVAFMLSSAHVLLQSQETLGSTVFTEHQDTENDPRVTDTVVIKLTADIDGEPASAMRVVGARDPFCYGPAAGSAAQFNARLWHISVPPASQRPHIKLTLFCKPIPGSAQKRKRDWEVIFP